MVLIEDEKPKPFVKTLPPKTKKPEQGGGAFHEKSEKNKKVNIVVTKAERMKKKYGKPKQEALKGNRRLLQFVLPKRILIKVFYLGSGPWSLAQEL